MLKKCWLLSSSMGKKRLIGKDWRLQSIPNFILEFLLIINNSHLLTIYHVLYIRQFRKILSGTQILGVKRQTTHKYKVMQIKRPN